VTGDCGSQPRTPVKPSLMYYCRVLPGLLAIGQVYKRFAARLVLSSEQGPAGTRGPNPPSPLFDCYSARLTCSAF